MPKNTPLSVVTVVTIIWLDILKDQQCAFPLLVYSLIILVDLGIAGYARSRSKRPTRAAHSLRMNYVLDPNMAILLIFHVKNIEFSQISTDLRTYRLGTYTDTCVYI